MQILQTTSYHRPVPTSLVGAAIDFILVTNPAPVQLPLQIAALAINLGYSAETAISLSSRITASIRMFADPTWPTIKELRASLDLGDSLVFVHAAQRFIANAALRKGDGFDVNALARSLTLMLPAHGTA